MLLLRVSHHRADPQNTPETIINADPVVLLPWFIIPRPAKIAVNDRIVVGFVRVRARVAP